MAVHEDEPDGLALVFRNRALEHAYRTATDTAEEHDLGRELAGDAVAAEAVRAFDAHCAAVPPASARPGGAPLDPAVRQKLKSLGYAD
jgi:hypothetical protein